MVGWIAAGLTGRIQNAGRPLLICAPEADALPVSPAPGAASFPSTANTRRCNEERVRSPYTGGLGTPPASLLREHRPRDFEVWRGRLRRLRPRARGIRKQVVPVSSAGCSHTWVACESAQAS